MHLHGNFFSYHWFFSFFINSIELINRLESFCLSFCKCSSIKSYGAEICHSDSEFQSKIRFSKHESWFDYFIHGFFRFHCVLPIFFHHDFYWISKDNSYNQAVSTSNFGLLSNTIKSTNTYWIHRCWCRCHCHWVIYASKISSIFPMHVQHVRFNFIEESIDTLFILIGNRHQFCCYSFCFLLFATALLRYGSVDSSK